MGDSANPDVDDDGDDDSDVVVVSELASPTIAKGLAAFITKLGNARQWVDISRCEIRKRGADTNVCLLRGISGLSKNHWIGEVRKTARTSLSTVEVSVTRSLISAAMKH